jgi:hypothetical protein
MHHFARVGLSAAYQNARLAIQKNLQKRNFRGQKGKYDLEANERYDRDEHECEGYLRARQRSARKLRKQESRHKLGYLHFPYLPLAEKAHGANKRKINQQSAYKNRCQSNSS